MFLKCLVLGYLWIDEADPGAIRGTLEISKVRSNHGLVGVSIWHRQNVITECLLRCPVFRNYRRYHILHSLGKCINNDHITPLLEVLLGRRKSEFLTLMSWSIRTLAWWCWQGLIRHLRVHGLLAWWLPGGGGFSSLLCVISHLKPFLTRFFSFQSMAHRESPDTWGIKTYVFTILSPLSMNFLSPRAII